MHSKDLSKEKHNKDEKINQEEVPMNPQKRRLEQLRQRKEQEEAAREAQTHGKNRSRSSKEPATSRTPKKNVKMSAEPVDCEYSAEEDHDEEEYKNVKNETLRKLMMDKKRLEKSLRVSGENEKKLKSMLDAAAQWFDKYESILDELDEQLTAYDTSRKLIVDSTINNVKPLCERWKESRKTMQALKFGGMGISTTSFFGNLAHYGISILRQVLFAMAYCRDLVSTKSTSDSPRTITGSPNLVAIKK